MSIERTIRFALCCVISFFFFFEVANALLTVLRAVGNLSGNPILLQLESTEVVKGGS